MKKFCSSCGNQLELSKRTCSECGAANPFYMPNFRLLEDQGAELEKLRREKEKIELELAAKEAAQAEFVKQEQLKERRKRDVEYEPEVRSELLKLKLEIELHRKETIQLLNQIRGELLQKLEQGSRLTKNLVETAIKNQPEQVAKPNKPFVYTAPESSNKFIAGNMVLIFTLLFFIGVGGGSIYVYFNKPNERKHEMMLPVLQQTTYKSTENSVALDTSTGDAKTENSNFPPNTLMAATSTKPAIHTSTADSVQPKEPFDLTVTRAMDDLIGRNLSGCNIVIRSISEINAISQPVLVEKLPSGSLKYKFNVTVKRNKETYTSSPYIYYTTEGRFLRIDGTNCK